MSAFKTASTLKLKPRTIVWLRNDQRVADNPVLSEALKLGQPTLCVYCFDPRHFKQSRYGHLRTDKFRARFLCQSIKDLRTNLRATGSDLLTAWGKPEDVISSLLEGVEPGSHVLVQGECTIYEKAVEDRVEAAIRMKAKMTKLLGATLYHRQDIPFKPDLSDLPDGFTPFKMKVEKHCAVRPCLPVPALGASLANSVPESELGLQGVLQPHCSFSFLPSEKQLGIAEGALTGVEEGQAPSDQPVGQLLAKAGFSDKGVLPFVGGERAALERVEQWVFKQDKLKDYFNIRNGMLGAEYRYGLPTGTQPPLFVAFYF